MAGDPPSFPLETHARCHIVSPQLGVSTRETPSLHDLWRGEVTMRVTFAHGLWSSTESSKAKHMRSLGWDVMTLDMRAQGWNQQQQTQVVLDAIDEHGPFDLLVGSSFGGLATANAAAQRPDLDLKLVLLAPAFGYHDLLREQLGPKGMETWKTTGTRAFEPPGWEEPVNLPYGFVEDAVSVSWPELIHPTAILHGIKDDVVPLANSQRAIEGRPNVHLEVVDDDHRLHGSLDRLADMAAQVLNGTSNPS